MIIRDIVYRRNRYLYSVLEKNLNLTIYPFHSILQPHHPPRFLPMQKGKTPFIVKSQDLRLYLYTQKTKNKKKKRSTRCPFINTILFLFFSFLSI